MAKHTRDELAIWQQLPLEIKISMTKFRIRDWYNYWGGDVYVSFSGGKDSTVLLDLVRQDYPDVEAVFVDTGLEYPEIREFVKTFDNVTWLRPGKNFKQVITEYGYPFISKETSECIERARTFVKAIKYGDTSEHNDARDKFKRLCGIGEYSSESKRDIAMKDLEEFARKLSEQNKNEGKPFSDFGFLMLMGEVPSKQGYDRSMFSAEKYKFFLEAPEWIPISAKCCKIMKKAPVHKFAKESGKKPMTAQMADESRLRTQQWIKNGCNGFDLKSPISNPMSFWTEQDVLLYIKLFGKDMVKRRIQNIEDKYGCALEEIIDGKTGNPKYLREDFTAICSVYGDIVEDYEKTENIEGQMSVFDYEGVADESDKEMPPLKTTGCKRTGCMFCGYGCHLEPEGEGRFEMMRKTHPKQYDYIMRPMEKGGLNYKEVIDWINEHGNLNIRY